MTERPEPLLQHFREAFRDGPTAAYRDWFRLQEELRDRKDSQTARALADDLWRLLRDLSFDPAEERARFFHNVAVFFGSPGPAADLSRARECFAVALAEWTPEHDPGSNARALHNYATAVSNLATSAEEAEESVALFKQALLWRTAEREIARGVTLHNLGLAWRRLAELSAGRAAEALEQSARCLREAIEIRQRRGLPEGHALSLFHLGLTLERLAESSGASSLSEARDCLARSAEEFDRLGKSESASIARGRVQDD